MKHGPGSCGSKLSESEHQRPSSTIPEGRQAKRPRNTGQMSYARAAQEGMQMVIVCDGYLKAQLSNESFINIQRVIGELVDELPEEGFTPQAHRYLLGKRGCHCGMPG